MEERTLIDRGFGDGLAEAVRALSDAPPGTRAELWCFDPPRARGAAEAALRRAGIEARVRPAFKAGLAAFREALAPRPGDRVEIECPAAPGAFPDRFVRELHPLADLLRVPVAFRLGAAVAFAPGLARCTALLRPAGGGAPRAVRAAVPVRPRSAPDGTEVLAACGWRRVTPPGADAPAEDAPWRTPLEAALSAAFAALAAESWRGRGPHFGRLTLRLEAALEDEPLGVGQEALSLAEALHEELYFGALEHFRAVAGLDPGDRTLTPGRIVPEIVPSAGPVRLRAAATPPPSASRPPVPSGPPAPAPDLGALDRAPAAAAVAAGLAALGGRALTVRSREGRAVEGRVLSGEGRAVVVTGGQHANEPTGVVGALAAARTLAGDGAPLGVCALENPDGWALYRELLAAAPRHMHHAARYTASGADLAFAPGFEADMRARLRDATGADLHLSLHGYPAHEWVRPFSGYLPPGFEDWCQPRGVFLILRAEPGWEARGRAALRAAAAALNADPEIAALNRAQIARLTRVAPGVRLTRIGDVPVEEGGRPGGPFPVQIITEAPDETVEGPAFRRLARAQRLAAVAAARAWRLAP